MKNRKYYRASSASPTSSSQNMCNPYITQLFSGIFGLPKTAIKSVTFMQDRFSIVLCDRPDDPIIVQKKDPTQAQTWPDKKGHIEHNDIMFHIPTPSPVDTYTVRTTISRAPFLSFAMLRSTIQSSNTSHDPQIMKKNMTRRVTSRNTRYVEPGYTQWGNREARNLFMFANLHTGGLAQGYCEVMFYFPKLAFIHHGDEECHSLLSGCSSDRLMPAVNYALYKHDAPHPVTTVHSIDTTLYDHDIVTGAIHKVTQAIDYAKHKLDCSTVCIKTACTSQVIGEDIESVVKKANAERKGSFYYIYTPEGHCVPQFPLFGRMIAQAITPSPKKQKRIPRSINILGLPLTSSGQEILDVISSSGITINSTLFPLFDQKNAQHYHQAALQVFLPNKIYDEFYHKIFYPLSIPRINSPLPYGFKRTDALISAIHTHFGLSGSFFKSTHYRSLRAKWRALRLQAKRYTVGIVIPYSYFSLLDDAQHGIPLLQFLEEIGFTLDIVLYCPEEHYGPFEKKLHTMLSGPQTHTIRFYQNSRWLRNWLDTSPTDLVYSDLYCDERIATAGKEQFCLADIEFGYMGSIRTAQRLLQKCQNSFVHTYKKYISPRSTSVISMRSI